MAQPRTSQREWLPSPRSEKTSPPTPFWQELWPADDRQPYSHHQQREGKKAPTVGGFLDVGRHCHGHRSRPDDGRGHWGAHTLDSYDEQQVVGNVARRGEANCGAPVHSHARSCQISGRSSVE